MILHGLQRHCNIGYYQGWDGYNDLQSCLEKCLAQAQCGYVSFKSNESCSRYKRGNCELVNDKYKGYTTFKKIEKGTTL